MVAMTANQLNSAPGMGHFVTDVGTDCDRRMVSLGAKSARWVGLAKKEFAHNVHPVERRMCYRSNVCPVHTHTWESMEPAICVPTGRSLTLIKLHASHASMDSQGSVESASNVVLAESRIQIKLIARLAT